MAGPGAIAWCCGASAAGRSLAGFRVRVIHCWWTFESVDQARELLAAGFGELGVELAERMKRPRLEYQVAIYHRSVPAACKAKVPRRGSRRRRLTLAEAPSVSPCGFRSRSLIPRRALPCRAGLITSWR